MKGLARALVGGGLPSGFAGCVGDDGGAAPGGMAGSGEAHCAKRLAFLLSGTEHKCSQQVVGKQVHDHFALGDAGTFAAQQFHTQGGFDIAKQTSICQRRR